MINWLFCSPYFVELFLPIALVERGQGPSCGRCPKHHPRLIDRSWPSWRSTRAPGPWDCRVVDSRDLWKWCWWTLSWWWWWWWWWWWCLALQLYQILAIFDLTPNIIMPKSQSCTTNSINSLAGFLPSTCATNPTGCALEKPVIFVRSHTGFPITPLFQGPTENANYPFIRPFIGLVGGFNPSQKNMSQIGNLPQIGMNIQPNYLKTTTQNLFISGYPPHINVMK